jgi:hypothetical protein
MQKIKAEWDESNYPEQDFSVTEVVKELWNWRNHTDRRYVRMVLVGGSLALSGVGVFAIDEVVSTNIVPAEIPRYLGGVGLGISTIGAISLVLSHFQNRKH